MRKKNVYPILLTTAVFLSVTGCSVGNEIPVATYESGSIEKNTEKNDGTAGLVVSEGIITRSNEEITADYLLNHAFKGSAFADSISYRMYQEADAVLSNGAEMKVSYAYMVDENCDYFHQYGSGSLKQRGSG